MILELEANNRAAAERDATLAGMDVQHVEQVSEDGQQPTQGTRVTHRGEFPEERHTGLWIGLAVALLAAIVCILVFFWDRIGGAASN
jgi:hypothetical protein